MRMMEYVHFDVLDHVSSVVEWMIGIVVGVIVGLVASVVDADDDEHGGESEDGDGGK